MKKTLLVAVALFTLLIAMNTFVLACDKGCTPGFWKQTQHFDQWNTYFPTQKLNEVFGCGDSTTTLLQALESQGGGIYALQRHAVGALLNSTAFPCFDITTTTVISTFCAALSSSTQIETAKDLFEGVNDQFCPLK